MGILSIGGLASGLDTDSLIKKMMTLERRPVVQLEQKRDKLTAEANAWRDLNSRLLTLQKRVVELKSAASSSFQSRKSTVADATVMTASVSSTAVAGDYTVQVTGLAQATTWQNNLATADATAALAHGGGTIQVTGGPGNGKTLTIAANDSLNTIAQKINDAAKSSATDLGFKASVIQINPGDYRLVLTGKNGAANDFSITDQAGTAADWLKLTAGTGNKAQAATNSSIKINNVTVNTASNTVTGAIQGVTLNLLKVGTTTVSVIEDQQKAVDAAKAFVDQYNSVVDFIDQQTKYDSKTKKAAVLTGEGLASSVKSTLSRLVGDPVAGQPDAFNSLAQIGISTSKFAGKETGQSQKLVLDETKFKNALSQDTDAMSNLFTVSSGANQGIAVRLENWLNTYTSTGGAIINRASSLDTSVTSIKDRITEFDTQILPLREKRLHAQFTSLEKSMATFQNQGSWLTSQLASMSALQKQ